MTHLARIVKMYRLCIDFLTKSFFLIQTKDKSHKCFPKTWIFADNPTDENRQDILAELNTMKKLPPHQNVIQLLGCVTKTGIKSRDVQKFPYYNVSNKRYVFWVTLFTGVISGKSISPLCTNSRGSDQKLGLMYYAMMC